MTNPTEFVTRTEFLREVNDVKTALSDVDRRVTGLFNLANHMGYSVDVPTAPSVPESTSDTDRPSVTPTFTGTATVSNGSGVDYVGVAYGLLSIKRDAVASEADVPSSYFSDMVDWFVTCFRNDSSFNETEFRLNAGV